MAATTPSSRPPELSSVPVSASSARSADAETNWSTPARPDDNADSAEAAEAIQNAEAIGTDAQGILDQLNLF
jgi:hypothetical protein